jgi:integrase
MADTTPRKPAPGLPIFLHASGQYAWKFRGKFYYLGKDPIAAVERYLREHEWVRAGKQDPERLAAELTLRSLLDDWLVDRKLDVDSGAITLQRWEDLHRTARRALEVIDGDVPILSLPPDAWRRGLSKSSSRLGPTTRKVLAGNLRSAINWAIREGLLPASPALLDAIRGPNPREISRHRYRVTADHGLRLFTATEFRALLEACRDVTDKAIVLLSLNCAFEPHDLAALQVDMLPPLSACPAWLHFPRPKTGVVRRAPIWPVTLSATWEAVESTPVVKCLQRGTQAVFRRATGPVGKVYFVNRFRRIAEAAGVYRKQVGLLGLRRSFATIAGETGDQAAVDTIMGHARRDMASVYRQGVSDLRLLRCTDMVHRWALRCNVPEWESSFADNRLPFL